MEQTKTGFFQNVLKIFLYNKSKRILRVLINLTSINKLDNP